MEPQDINDSAFDLGGFIAIVKPDMSHGDQVCIANTFIDIFGIRIGLSNPSDIDVFIMAFRRGYMSVSPDSPVSRHQPMSLRKRK